MHYVKHLSKDKILRPLIVRHGPLPLRKQSNLWLYLCYSIMSQQLSTRVADVIRQRFIALFGGEPDPQQLLAMPPEKLRSVGLSQAKTQYIRNVAAFELEKGMKAEKLELLSDGEIIEYLTQIKGVGRWTTEMLLMFALGREDVFAVDDLGLQNAIIALYQLRHRKKKNMLARIRQISEQWSPYRSYASLYLWRWKDNPPG